MYFSGPQFPGAASLSVLMALSFIVCSRPQNKDLAGLAKQFLYDTFDIELDRMETPSIYNNGPAGYGWAEYADLSYIINMCLTPKEGYGRGRKIVTDLAEITINAWNPYFCRGAQPILAADFSLRHDGFFFVFHPLLAAMALIRSEPYVPEMFSRIHFTFVPIYEQADLYGEGARLLHAILCSKLGTRNILAVDLYSLAKTFYGDMPDGRPSRRLRGETIVKHLAQIDRLPGWTVDAAPRTPDVFTICRGEVPAVRYCPKARKKPIAPVVRPAAPPAPPADGQAPDGARNSPNLKLVK
jgi:hypothetical protein